MTTLPPPRNGRILFIDMNSFFASCEQAENVRLAGQPVIVVPTEGSCALSASYEAKAYGVKTGTSEREARFRVPNLQVIKARPKLYMDYHYRLQEILCDLSPRVTMRSVDEGSIELCRNEDPQELAHAIKEQIWRQLGIVVNCSIGIGPNIFLAKLGTELQKPDGLVEIRLEDLEQTYRQVNLRDLCGINYAMERQLHRAGIYSVLDFYRADATYLNERFGVNGYRWWLKLHGYEVADFIHSPRRSLSHSHVLPPKYRAPRAAYKTLLRLISKVGRRLRKEGYAAGWIGLFVRFVDGTSFAEHLRITPASDTITLVSHITRLWQQAAPKELILKLTVWTTELTGIHGIPPPLFASERKRLALARALDTVNDRYGADTLRFATLDTEGSSAPDRISFTALFDIEHE